MLRALIQGGFIAQGDVDERNIRDVKPTDLRGYTQCHFFAGIGGWSVALRLAGWPDNRPVWTGSCPCQPFSVAGKRRGRRDARHVWPVWCRLIAECQAPIVFGEQVASPLGREWLSGVRSSLEALGRAVGAADLCAASVGAPHIRQRLYWMADPGGAERQRRGFVAAGCEEGALRDLAEPDPADGLADTEGQGYPRGEHAGAPGKEEARGPRMLGVGGYGSTRGLADRHWPGCRERRAKNPTGIPQRHRRGPTGTPVSTAAPEHGLARRLGNSGIAGLPAPERQALRAKRRQDQGRAVAQPDRPCGFWDDYLIIACADGKLRRTPAEPIFFPLADGFPGRNDLLRGAGDAVVPQVAAAFIQAASAAISERRHNG